MSLLTPKEEITVNSYNAVSDLWASDHATKKFWGDNFDYFHELLPHGRILEVGCGSGRDAKTLLELGYEYVGTDISEGLLKQARKNNTDAHFEEVSLYDLRFETPFDGFWCAAVLIHLPKERIHEGLDAIKRNLKSKAIGFIAVKEGFGEKLEMRPELNNAEFLFSYYEDDEFQDILMSSNFNVLRQGRMPMSKRTTWLTYHVQLNESLQQ